MYSSGELASTIDTERKASGAYLYKEVAFSGTSVGREASGFRRARGISSGPRDCRKTYFYKSRR